MTENRKVRNEVLIADDDPLSRRMLEAFLTKSGYRVVTAVDGVDALKILTAEDSPSLAILDWMMPGLEGPQVCDERGRTWTGLTSTSSCSRLAARNRTC